MRHKTKAICRDITKACDWDYTGSWPYKQVYMNPWSSPADGNSAWWIGDSRYSSDPEEQKNYWRCRRK